MFPKLTERRHDALPIHNLIPPLRIGLLQVFQWRVERRIALFVGPVTEHTSGTIQHETTLCRGRRGRIELR
jgi:hypothetical protein